MAQNMQLSDSDRLMLGRAVGELLERRKQLAPYPFDIPQTEQLYIPPPIYKVLRQIEDTSATYAALFHQEHVQVVWVRGITDKPVAVKIRVNRGDRELVVFNTRRVRDKVYAVKNVDHYPEFKAWVASAAKVQAMNEHVSAIFRDVLKKCTTYRQLHLALPETLKAVSAWCEHVDHWYDPRSREKFKKVYIELSDVKKSRARKLPQEMRDHLDKHRHHVERTLAMAVMLPRHNGNNKDSVFDQTWISGRLL